MDAFKVYVRVYKQEAHPSGETLRLASFTTVT